MFPNIMAGYLDIGAFGENTVERNKCRETLELAEEQLSCQALSTKEKCQDETTVPDESTV